ncbi:MAG: type II toxin-antitoxin system RelE/ParE family toxin [Thermoanaerobaculales bacterium]|nr:type II toxin-antitoxin system RelE/ParE family toxin [Thermoanaerobaculales bacterium]
MTSASIEISWERRAVKELKAINTEAQRRIVTAVEQLIEQPMKGTMLSAQWKGLRRLRVGEFRVIYAFDGSKLLISVIRIGHRREVYR